MGKTAHNQSLETQDVVKTASGSALTIISRNDGIRKERWWRENSNLSRYSCPSKCGTPRSAFPFMSSSSVGMTVTGSGSISPTCRASCCSAFLDLRRFRDLFSILLMGGGSSPLHGWGLVRSWRGRCWRTPQTCWSGALGSALWHTVPGRAGGCVAVARWRQELKRRWWCFTVASGLTVKHPSLRGRRPRASPLCPLLLSCSVSSERHNREKWFNV